MKLPWLYVSVGIVALRSRHRQLAIVDHASHPPLFSERNGYKRFWHVGRFCLRSERTA